jgi:hypothetical protein
MEKYARRPEVGLVQPGGEVAPHPEELDRIEAGAGP